MCTQTQKYHLQLPNKNYSMNGDIMRKQRILQLTAILIPLLSILLYLMKDIFLSLVPLFPACPFYTKLNIYCPACGNTRSVLALLDGHFLDSLRYNIVPILLLILSLLAYLEVVAYAFFKPIRLLPRKLSFYLTIIGLLILYFVLRNFSPYLTP